MSDKASPVTVMPSMSHRARLPDAALQLLLLVGLSSLHAGRLVLPGERQAVGADCPAGKKKKLATTARRGTCGVAQVQATHPSQTNAAAVTANTATLMARFCGPPEAISSAGDADSFAAPIAAETAAEPAAVPHITCGPTQRCERRSVAWVRQKILRAHLPQRPGKEELERTPGVCSLRRRHFVTRGGEHSENTVYEAEHPSSSVTFELIFHHTPLVIVQLLCAGLYAMPTSSPRMTRLLARPCRHERWQTNCEHFMCETAVWHLERSGPDRVGGAPKGMSQNKGLFRTIAAAGRRLLVRGVRAAVADCACRARRARRRAENALGAP